MSRLDIIFDLHYYPMVMNMNFLWILKKCFEKLNLLGICKILKPQQDALGMPQPLMNISYHFKICSLLIYNCKLTTFLVCFSVLDKAIFERSLVGYATTIHTNKSMTNKRMTTTFDKNLHVDYRQNELKFNK